VTVVEHLGGRAAAALGESGGVARVVARLSESTWLTAAGEIVWLGRSGSALHPRAMLTQAPLIASGEPPDGDLVTIDARHARPWRPPELTLDAADTARLIAGAHHLRTTLTEIGRVDGLAHLIVASGATPDGMLAAIVERARPSVRALATACAANRAADAHAPAVALLGLGSGLTPSGDDFVGGLFFARSWLATTNDADAEGWRAAAAVVRDAARARTHAISQALLGDLLEGTSHAPLHALVEALATGADPRPAARALVRLGHSSGWDILAGLLTGLDDAR
jgi:hypothetical protein